MISRIMLSMRKAADSPQSAWSLVDPPGHGLDPRVGISSFASQGISYCREDDVPLDTYRVTDGDSVRMDC
jgi:hypothetical protein